VIHRDQAVRRGPSREARCHDAVGFQSALGARRSHRENASPDVAVVAELYVVSRLLEPNDLLNSGVASRLTCAAGPLPNRRPARVRQDKSARVDRGDRRSNLTRTRAEGCWAPASLGDVQEDLSRSSTRSSPSPTPRLSVASCIAQPRCAAWSGAGLGASLRQAARLASVHRAQIQPNPARK
jgi:hypothetical protein